MIQKLDESLLKEAANWLSGRDAALERVLRQYGYPPLWNREPGFATLIHIILEQQVSLASANAAFGRLRARIQPVNPDNFLSLREDDLRAIGFSRQKMAYAQALAVAVRDERLDLPGLEHMPDEDARNTLKQLKGIGDWTADIYLSECLLRPDILPKGDIAMQEAFRVLNGLEKRPSHEKFVEFTRHWQPWRSVGARMLWHFYLSSGRPRHS